MVIPFFVAIMIKLTVAAVVFEELTNWLDVRWGLLVGGINHIFLAERTYVYNKVLLEVADSLMKTTVSFSFIVVPDTNYLVC